MKYSITEVLNNSGILAAAIAGLVSSAVCAQQSPIETPVREYICRFGRTERHQHNCVADNPGMMLFNNTTDQRRWYGYLLIDNSKTPVLLLRSNLGKTNFPAYRTQDLSEDMLQYLVPSVTRVDENNCSFESVGWQGGWKHFQVALRFQDGRCSLYKVSGPGIENTDWQNTSEIPSQFTTSTSTTPVPVEIMCGIDGPRDQSNCGGYE